MTYFLFIVIYLIGMSFTTALLNYLFYSSESQKELNAVLSILFWYVILPLLLFGFIIVGFFILFGKLTDFFENLLNKL